MKVQHNIDGKKNRQQEVQTLGVVEGLVNLTPKSLCRISLSFRTIIDKLCQINRLIPRKASGTEGLSKVAVVGTCTLGVLVPIDVSERVVFAKRGGAEDPDQGMCAFGRDGYERFGKIVL